VATKNRDDFNALAPRYWPTWLGLGVLRILSWLPMPVLALVGYLLGSIMYLVAGSRRRIALKNIKTCFPEMSESQARKTIFIHFCYIGYSVISLGFSWWASEARFSRFTRIENRQHYDQALAEGENIILLAPHFMALEAGGISLSIERPVVTMYQYSKNLLVNRMIVKNRPRFQGEIVERKEPLRNLIKMIKKGLPFYYLPDQDAGRKGLFVPFFGVQASTFPMLGKFAKLGDAVVIPCISKLEPWGRGLTISLGEPLSGFPVGDDLQDTKRMNQEVEKMIRQLPSQYLWAHKRFKTRPDGESKFYI